MTLHNLGTEERDVIAEFESDTLMDIMKWFIEVEGRPFSLDSSGPMEEDIKLYWAKRFNIV